MSIKSKLGAGAIGLCTLYASSVFAAALTGPPVIDTTTQGSWMGTYGECYNVLPQASPRTCIPEVQIGPDFKGDQPLQYINVMDPNCIRDGAAQPEFSEAVCVTGDATGNFDVRVFTDGENNAYAWGFDEPGSGGSAEVLPGRSQDNACKDVLPAGLHSPDDVYASTFDSDAYSRDPLSAEIKLTLGGDATIAYYFLSEADVCRAQDFVLSVNGTPVAGAAGTVDDISNGTYVVFDLIDIPDGALIRLDVTQGDPSCEPNAYNSHLSGIFVDGTNACLDPFCGDGNVDRDLGETCEMPGDPTNDGGVCRDDCTYCGDGITDPVEECDPANPDDPNAKMCTDSCEIIPEELGCRFTGGLKDVFENNKYSAGGQVGANTGQQPQPKGEWTHRQRRGPAGKFTFHGGTASAPQGSEIDVIRCSDPGGCKPSGDPPSPVKQLDFDGIGNFKNIGKKGRDVPGFVKDGNNNVKVAGGNRNYKGTLHWFEVNIDDLGEPGNTNPNKNPGDGTAACPAIGFGEKGEKELAECSCSDFYRITIYDGVDATSVPRNEDGSIDKSNMNTEDVIYEVWGYIDGGNLQLHHPTGFDLK